ncbi:MAG: TRAP transporter substrate-binding protein [Desulfovibrionaceae bacterium]|nr:TRAP transporter substrate-binding protein [Desulfovibrionaceae bacterium]
MSVKRFMVAALTGLIALGLSAMPSDAADKSVKLRLGHDFPEAHFYHKGAVRFAELVSEKTNGTVTVQIFPNGTLGKQGQLVEGLTMGTVDFALSNSVALEKYEQDMSVLAMPFLFKSWDQLYRAVDGKIGADLNKKLNKKGLDVLAYFRIGSIIINSTKPITHPSDVSNMKLRVMPGPSMIELGKALNAVVTPISYGEVYTALQLGTIDAQLQSVSNAMSGKHHEVAKYICLNNVSMFLEPLTMSKMTYDRLSADQQKAVREAAQEAAQYERVLALEGEQKDLEAFEEQGVTIIRPDIDEWRKVIEPIHGKFPQWAELIKEINALQ